MTEIRTLSDDEWIPEVVEVLSSFMGTDVPTAARMALRIGELFEDQGWQIQESYGSIEQVDEEEIRIEFDPAVVPRWMMLGSKRYDVIESGPPEQMFEDLARLFEPDAAAMLRRRFDEVESSMTDHYRGEPVGVLHPDDAARLADDVEEPELGQQTERWRSKASAYELSFGTFRDLDVGFRLDLRRQVDGAEMRESTCSNLPRSVAAALYDLLGRYLAATDEPDQVVEEETDEPDQNRTTFSDDGSTWFTTYAPCGHMFSASTQIKVPRTCPKCAAESGDPLLCDEDVEGVETT